MEAVPRAQEGVHPDSVLPLKGICLHPWYIRWPRHLTWVPGGVQPPYQAGLDKPRRVIQPPMPRGHMAPRTLILIITPATH